MSRAYELPVVDRAAARVRHTAEMLRDFAAADQMAVREVILAGLAERWGPLFDPSYNPDLDDIAQHYVARGAQVVVLEHAGRIVATGTLLDEGEGRARVVRMSVAASHRRRGLGRQVVAELVVRAGSAGFNMVDVLADTPWTSAVALYAACGFDIISQDEAVTHFRRHLH